jgi:Glycosyl hydrolase family 26
MKKALVLSVIVALGSYGCAASESGDDAGGAVETGGTGGPSGTGGAADKGGTTGTGGAIASGGTTGTGGATGSGGENATGGTTGSGGFTATGGITGSGGATGAGGTPGTGGIAGAAGNRGSGGKVGSGGATGTGGTPATGGTTGTGGTTTTSPCSVTPVSPGSSPQAQKLLCYLYSQYGNHVLSGQQEANWNANPTDMSWYNTNVGKYPAIDGSDFLYTNGASCTSVTASTTRAIAYWNAGGLTMFRYHVGEPVSGSTCAQDCYMGANCAEPTTKAAGSLLTNAITAGTAENTAWNNRLNYVAVQIGAMKAANVPVILALFHETQSNGWFWWAQGTADQFVALYKYAFNYLTVTKGLNNIIWLMPYSGSPTASFYPGASVVDIAGGDTYGSNQPFTSLYSSVKGIAGSTKPLALHETGLIPTPSAMFPTAAPWILFNIWAGYETSNNTVANIKSVYSDSHLITRDLIPNLK